MSNKLTSLAQLRQAALACQGLAADVAQAAAEAIGEVAAGLPVGRSVTLTAAGWTGSAAPYTQTAGVAGVLADEGAQLVQIVPASASRENWEAAGARCTGQGAGALTFEAGEKPGTDMMVYVILQEVRG